jgi:hypothetical protein
MLLRICLTLFTVFLLTPTAEARHHHRHHHAVPQPQTGFNWFQTPQQNTYTTKQSTHIVGGRPAGCPRAYCGCSVSLKVFGKIIPDLNLAANWGRFPRTSPASGMVAYRNHHAFYIESVNSDGTVLAYDGNSGKGLTRLHNVSLRGYTVVNPHGR